MKSLPEDVHPRKGGEASAGEQFRRMDMDKIPWGSQGFSRVNHPHQGRGAGRCTSKELFKPWNEAGCVSRVSDTKEKHCATGGTLLSSLSPRPAWSALGSNT